MHNPSLTDTTKLALDYTFDPVNGTICYKTPVKSCRKGDLSAAIYPAAGQPVVAVSAMGRQGIIRACQAMWLHCYAAIPDGTDVYHKDGDLCNNRLDNLELLTKRHRVPGTGTRSIGISKRSTGEFVMRCVTSTGSSTTKRFKTMEEARVFYDKLDASLFRFNMCKHILEFPHHIALREYYLKFLETNPYIR